MHQTCQLLDNNKIRFFALQFINLENTNNVKINGNFSNRVSIPVFILHFVLQSRGVNRNFTGGGHNFSRYIHTYIPSGSMYSVHCTQQLVGLCTRYISIYYLGLCTLQSVHSYKPSGSMYTVHFTHNSQWVYVHCTVYTAIYLVGPCTLYSVHTIASGFMYTVHISWVYVHCTGALYSVHSYNLVGPCTLQRVHATAGESMYNVHSYIPSGFMYTVNIPHTLQKLTTDRYLICF